MAHARRRELGVLRQVAVDLGSSALEKNFEGAFSEVVFAITDGSAERRFLGPFRDVFSA
jgi:hypothetical protein